MSGRWDPAKAKDQLRAATQHLVQLQRRIDSEAQFASKDIATLLSSRKWILARAKALDLIKEDRNRDVLKELEVYCDIIYTHFQELEKTELNWSPSTTEAAASIIFATPYVECPELIGVRDTLVSRTSSAFARSASRNLEGHVSPRIVRSIKSRISASNNDSCLHKIARTYGIEWEPQMNMDDKVSILSEMLETSDKMGNVDIGKFRTLALSGLPDSPTWLRPRAWKLLLGYTPLQKIYWESEWRKMRDGYYDLVRRQLEIIASLPLPGSTLSDSDVSLLNLAESLARAPTSLFEGLKCELEQSADCPLHDIATPMTKISCSSALDERLRLIHVEQTPARLVDQSQDIAEERLDADSWTSSVISTMMDGMSTGTLDGRSINSLQPLSLRVDRSVAAHVSHTTALLRILYVHRALHPADVAAEAPHVASLLVPLYHVMLREVEPGQLAHAEADTFWLFEVLLREISELIDREAGLAWMKRFGERLASIDQLLAEDLKLKGLDPAQPQFSYRWLVPLLSHTLPLPSMLRAWDSIISQPEASRQENPKLEHLLDVCAAMLVQARSRLFLLGKAGRKYNNDWHSGAIIIPSQQLLPWELSDAFTEGVAFLQRYPIEEMGGIDLVLQSAEDIFCQRADERKQHTGTLAFGARLANTVRRGFTNQMEPEDSSPDTTSSEEEDEESTENEDVHHLSRPKSFIVASSSHGWVSKLTSTVVRGITNQSAMEDDTPSPTSPVSISRMSTLNELHHHDSASPSLSSGNSLSLENSSTSSTGSSLWGYAEKLAQSDVAASLSKASTNISAKALGVWVTNTSPTSSCVSLEVRSTPHSPAMPIHSIIQTRCPNRRTDSVPDIGYLDSYSPPSQPLFFKEPRDSRIFTREKMSSLQLGDSLEPSTSPSTRTRAESLKSTISSWTSIQRVVSKPARSAPKPLILNASALITKTPEQTGGSSGSTRIPERDSWVKGMRDQAQLPLKLWASQQALSPMFSRPGSVTLSTSIPRSDVESDASASSSRFVRLNRQSLSPMAQRLRSQRGRRSASVSSRSDQSMPSPRLSGSRQIQKDEPQGDGWRSARLPDSPSTTPSSPPPWTPMTATGPEHHSISVSNSEQEGVATYVEEERISAENIWHRFKKPTAKMQSTAVQESVGEWSDSSVQASTPVISVASHTRVECFSPQVHLSQLPACEASQDIITAVAPVNGASLPSPGPLAALEFDSDSYDIATTPKAVAFPSTSPKGSFEPLYSPRRQKISINSGDHRQIASTDVARTGRLGPRQARARKSPIQKRESVANDGDDEGYDELLSAYDSEASYSDHPYQSDE